MSRVIAGACGCVFDRGPTLLVEGVVATQATVGLDTVWVEPVGVCVDAAYGEGQYRGDHKCGGATPFERRDDDGERKARKYGEDAQ